MQQQGCRLTSNQARAVELALRVGSGELAEPALEDADWALLLLASGLHGTCASPGKACAKVLEDLCRRTGYFADRDGHNPELSPETTYVGALASRMMGAVQ
jgi:hypothetical protein